MMAGQQKDDGPMKDFIEQKLRGWLQNRRPPQGMTKEQREAIIQDIVSVVRKAAPSTGVDGWIGEVIERAMVKAKGLGWPGVDIWAMAAGATPKPAAERDQTGRLSYAEQAYRRFCMRLNEGVSVAEHDLFSAKVCGRALQEQRVDLETVRRYQRNAFDVRAKIHGREAALAWLAGRAPKLAEIIRAEPAPEDRRYRPQHAADAEPEDAEQPQEGSFE